MFFLIDDIITPLTNDEEKFLSDSLENFTRNLLTPDFRLFVNNKRKTARLKIHLLSEMMLMHVVSHA